MQWMSSFWRFLKFLPSPAEIVSFSEVWLQPLRKFRQRVRTAHPPPQPGAKTCPQWRDASMLQNILPKRLYDGQETTPVEQVGQVGPRLPGQDVVSAIP